MSTEYLLDLPGLMVLLYDGLCTGVVGVRPVYLWFGNLCRDCVRCMFACPIKLVCVGLVSGLSYSPSSSDPRPACQRV